MNDISSQHDLSTVAVAQWQNTLLKILRAGVLIMVLAKSQLELLG
jgi:hypothetical protein